MKKICRAKDPQKCSYHKNKNNLSKDSEIMSPSQFFHGTNIDLEIGDFLLPGNQIDNKDFGRSEHVYLTTDKNASSSEAIKTAYSWARTACAIAEENDVDEEPNAYVYIVEPSSPPIPDGSEDVGIESVRTTSAKIIGVVSMEELYDHVPPVGKTYLD